MKQLTGNDRDECIKDMVSAAINEFGISKDQAQKRVDALLKAMYNGLFDGIPDSGPSDFLESLFVKVKTEQIMKTQID